VAPPFDKNKTEWSSKFKIKNNIKNFFRSQIEKYLENQMGLKKEY